jgi:hypothetical protein
MAIGCAPEVLLAVLLTLGVVTDRGSSATLSKAPVLVSTFTSAAFVISLSKSVSYDYKIFQSFAPLGLSRETACGLNGKALIF